MVLVSSEISHPKGLARDRRLMTAALRTSLSSAFISQGDTRGRWRTWLSPRLELWRMPSHWLQYLTRVCSGYVQLVTAGVYLHDGSVAVVAGALRGEADGHPHLLS